MALVDDIMEILSEMHPDVDFTSHQTLIDDKILDSFDIVTLIAEMSNEFDVTIPAKEIVTENFKSATALAAMVSRLLDE